MGHNLLPRTPTSARWQDVVAHVAGGGSVEEVAAAAVHAADRDLSRAARDPVFVEAVRLLAAIPIAAAGTHPGEELEALGLTCGSNPSTPALLGAVSRRLDEAASDAGRGTDFGELSRRALIASLVEAIDARTPKLAPPEPGDTIRALAALRRTDDFAALSRRFFGRLVSEALSNWVDRILPQHLGEDRRFADIAAENAFARALDVHVRETTRIIQEYASGWYGKTLGEGGAVTYDKAQRFGGYAFTKIRRELSLRAEDDG